MAYGNTDIHPDHIDPETNRPYADYSSPSLDTDFHDDEMDDDEDDLGFECCPACPHPDECLDREECELS